MKSHQLKSLVKGIIREMIANKNAIPEPMGAVNTEALGQTEEKPWKEIDSGFFKINSDLARKLGGGKLPGPGMEKLVAAPKGFQSKRGFVWLAPTISGGNPVWSIRDAHNWKLVNGMAVLSSSDVTGVDEQTSTGAVAGYSTPFAFSKKKQGSGRAIQAAKKYGTVVKSISEETK